MTLNGVIALILSFFSTKFDNFLADYVAVAKDRPIMSVKYCLPVPVFHLWPILTYVVRLVGGKSLQKQKPAYGGAGDGLH